MKAFLFSKNHNWRLLKKSNNYTTLVSTIPHGKKFMGTTQVDQTNVSLPLANLRASPPITLHIHSAMLVIQTSSSNIATKCVVEENAHQQSHNNKPYSHMNCNCQIFLVHSKIIIRMKLHALFLCVYCAQGTRIWLTNGERKVDYST